MKIDQERYRAAAEAKSTTARALAPLSRHDAALKRYLGAAQYETAGSRSGWDDWAAPPTRHPAPVTTAVRALRATLRLVYAYSLPVVR